MTIEGTNSFQADWNRRSAKGGKKENQVVGKNTKGGGSFGGPETVHTARDINVHIKKKGGKLTV